MHLYIKISAHLNEVLKVINNLAKIFNLQLLALCRN